jgi:predicted nucleotidyltransferase
MMRRDDGNMTWTLSRLQERRELILEAARRRGMRAVRVFGSVCRGEATPTSDVDFLVQVESGRSLLDLGGFVADLEELLGCRVDVVSERGLSPRFRERVLAEAVAL